MKKIAVVSSFAILVSALSLCGQTADKNDSANAPFRNPELSIEQRVNDLVSRLTIEEKAAQMVHTAPAIPRLGIQLITGGAKGCTARRARDTRQFFLRRLV